MDICLAELDSIAVYRLA